ncbi:MAG: dienelactone hydrolase family protein [Xanthomonadales bacterium]|nr:dienelactone hydrolase family protein [Xanthomonadales bacterium]
MTIRLAVLLLLAAGSCRAETVVEKHEYEIDGRVFESVLVYDGALRVHRPGLVMVPNWMGVTDAAIEKARVLAGSRYVVLVADMYGKNLRPADAAQAGQASGAVLADRALTRARVAAAVDALAEHGRTVLLPGRIAAVGFCFGGTTVLELARSGADVAAVVSLHGNPEPVLAAGKGEVRAAVLVLHGADDPWVPDGNLRAFEAEMRAAGADWTLASFGGAVHCFAEADADLPPGCRYDARAARRAYAMLHDFLEEHLAGR